MTAPDYPIASLIRRSAAMTYDALLILAILMLASLPLSSLEPHDNTIGFIAVPWLRFVYQAYLFYLIFLFYYIFWRIKGQTLGMQVWKIRTVDNSGRIMSPGQCILRFALATPSILLAFTGYLWAILDKDKLTVYDRLSHSRVVYVGDRPYASEKARQVASE